MSENEIIPVSNQATELPNLIHVFSGRKHVSSFADCFTGMVSFFVVYWLLHIRVEKRSVEKRKAVRLVPCQARLAERIRVWLGGKSRQLWLFLRSGILGAGGEVFFFT